MNKTKHKLIILALSAVFVFSWGAVYSPVKAQSGSVTTGSPTNPDDGSDSKGSGGKGTKQKPQSPPPSNGGGKGWIEVLIELLWYL